MFGYFIPEVFLGLGAFTLLFINILFKFSNKRILVFWNILFIITFFVLIFNNCFFTSYYISNKFIFHPSFLYLKGFLIIAIIFLILSIKNFLINFKYINEFLFFVTINVSFQSMLLNTIDFLLAFILIETISFLFYLLVSFNKKDLLSIEAGLKYFYLGTISAFIFFLGIFFIYYSSLELSLVQIFQSSKDIKDFYLILGLLLILISIVFKLGGAPFHFWIPEVYQGSPLFVLPILISLSKLTFTVFLVNILSLIIKFQSKIEINFYILSSILSIFAILSMFIGNFLGIKQNELKRILSYSSIAHIGYLLSILSIPWTKINLEIAYGYVFIYALCNYTFLIGLLYSLNGNILESKIYIDKDFSLKISKNLFIFVGILICIISLSGLPPTAGFILKLIILIHLFKQHYYLLASIFLITSILSLYYYFRLLFPFLKNINLKETLNLNFIVTEILISIFMVLVCFYLIFSTFNFNYIFFVKL